MKNIELEEKQERQLKYGLLALLVIVLTGIHFLDPDFYTTIYHLSKSGNLQETIEYLRGFGIYAAFVSFFIDVIINIVGFLPSIFISTANGLVFGLFWGTVISWLAETTGVMLSFWVMRTLFRGIAKKIILQSKVLMKLDSYDSWQAVLVARAIPYMPNGLVTAVCALSGISAKHYFIGSLIGKLPSVALEVVIGHDVVNMEDHALRLSIIVIIVSVIYFVIWRYMNRNKPTGTDI